LDGVHCSDKSKEENANGSGDDDSDDDAEKDVDDEEDVLDDESEEYLARLEKVCQRWITIAFKSQSLCWYKCTKLFVIKQSKGENFCLKIRLAAWLCPDPLGELMHTPRPPCRRLLICNVT